MNIFDRSTRNKKSWIYLIEVQGIIYIYILHKKRVEYIIIIFYSILFLEVETEYGAKKKNVY